MVNSKDSILKDYQFQAAAQQDLISRLKKTLNTFSLYRLGLFGMEIILVACIITLGYHWTEGLLACLPVLLFLVVIRRQSGIQQELEAAQKLLFVYQNEVNTMSLGSNAYDSGQAFADDLHPYSADLDIYGEASLYALVNRSGTTAGMRMLAENLGRPCSPAVIGERQQAIQELQSHIRDSFHFRAGLHGHQPEQLDTIARKLEHELPAQLSFVRQPFLKTYTGAAPFLSLGLLLAGSLMGGGWWQALVIGLLFHLTLSFYHMKSVNQIYYGFSGSSGLLNGLSGTIRWTEQTSWQSPLIRRFCPGNETGVPLSGQISRLSRIINAFDVRLNPLLGSLFNAFALWDFRCALRLGEWHRQYAGQLISGFDTISRFEELISFATLAHNEPGFSYPEIAADFHFSARALGHPLIGTDKRVVNDYHFAAGPTVDLITGSNMAGKSTFLRTAGINMVLAFAGAPVCAEKMKVSLFELLSYMRIRDSLQDQTSTFKAELNRLKMILEGVSTLNHPLVLIDEMLRGTNSRDKYLGSRVFIRQMLRERAPALFATHDLQLSEMSADYPETLRNYHFDIQLAGGEMHFDYKIKTGACKTFNAALLLEQIGLRFDPDEQL